ncbi:NAD(P)/FAD-dependent oxidoreductase [Henriciella litoralis]|uniref:NAD(P)/FAD-dependent oxidoreductase n=1 Tax=Henriciella litoralis TaxID=568102 RepID=UPI0009FF9D39|nr:FAD-dependent oxidoreductase [Henriciella litoralis]
MKIAIIGAGMAGLAAARPLVAAGHDVSLYDKGRGPGGRLSTRRAQTPIGEVRWDHGAQFFTARSEGFRTFTKQMMEAGAVAAWSPRMLADSEAAPGKSDTKYVGTPSMNAVIKAMASDLDVEWGRRVSEIAVSPEGKQLRFEDGRLEGPFDRVIVAIPAEQAAELLAGVSDKLAGEAAAVRSAPCWAVMLAFDEKLETSWDAAAFEGAPISWAARNASKPGRGDAETWILHASADWSRAHVDADASSVAETLWSLFQQKTGAPAPVYCGAHRWLLAQVEQGAGSPFGWDADVGIGAVGDWRIAPRIEAAWESGRAIADFLKD